MEEIEQNNNVEPESSTEEESYYVIDPLRLRELNRSLDSMLENRCPGYKDNLKPKKRGTTDNDLLKAASSACTKQEGFILPGLPLQDIVFRSLIRVGNKVTSLTYLHEEVTDKWYTPLNPRSLSSGDLKKVLDTDMYYGFSKVEAPSKRT